MYSYQYILLQAIETTALKMQSSVIETNMTDPAFENALLEHFWYQLKVFTSLSWIYYGDAATGNFIGLRRSWACEAHANCTYPNSTFISPTRPAVPEGSIIRLLTNPAKSQVEAYTTSPDKGSDARSLLYTESFVTTERIWYTSAWGKSTNNNIWVDPYDFTGGAVGVTVSRTVTKDSLPLGVLAADFELDVVSNIIAKTLLGDDSTILFLMTQSRLLLNSTVEGISEVKDSAVKTVGEHLFSERPEFGDEGANWTALSSAAYQNEVTYEGVLLQYDAVGVFMDNLRWVLVVAAPESSFPSISPPENGCLTTSACFSSISNAQKRYRSLTIDMFQKQTLAFLSAGVSAITQLNTAFNMGYMNANPYCGEDVVPSTPCGGIEFENEDQMVLLQKNVEISLRIYGEISWLYFGFDAGQVVGYVREGESLHLWKTCDGRGGCDSGNAFWASLTENSSTLKSRDATSDITTREWFQLATQLNMTTDDTVAWTDPYSFVNGEVGITVIQKALGGDFRDGSNGVWGADYTLLHLKSLIGDFYLEEAKIYLMDVGNDRGRVLVSNGGETMVAVGEAEDEVVKQSGNTVLEGFTTPGQSGAGFSVLMTVAGEGGDETRYFVEAASLRDADPACLQSFDWVLVVVSPELASYTEIRTTTSPPDDSFPIGITLALIFSVVAFLGITLSVCISLTYRSVPVGLEGLKERDREMKAMGGVV